MSGNTGDEFEDFGLVGPSSTTAADHSYLGGDAAVAFTGVGNVTGDAPGLEALADNGGLTDTMRPAPGSPLVDAGAATISGVPDTDQRAVSRVVGTIDIGAVEVDPGQLDLAPTAVTVAEADGSVTFTVTRSGRADGAVTALFATTDGTAVAGSDYTATAPTLTWADGETGTRDVSIPIAGDDLAEGDEDFTASIDVLAGGASTGADTATVTITDSTTATTTTTTTTATVPPTTVAPTNGPPVISPIADRVLAPGASDVVIVSVNDPDGDELTLVAEPADSALIGDITVTEVTGGVDGPAQTTMLALGGLLGAAGVVLLLASRRRIRS